MDTRVDASGPLLYRGELRRLEERAGALSATAFLNPVEMKSDSIRGDSEGIRITRRLPEHFPKGWFLHDCLYVLSPVGKPLIAPVAA